jgi:nicotinate-nucleotide pyrophosphorylase
VECQSVAEALEACGAGADIVMLDNFTPDTIGAAAAEVKAVYPHILVEASGVSLFCIYSICIYICIYIYIYIYI